MSILIQVFAAYLLADLLTGIYHFFTDNGYNIKSQVQMFQEHHDRPEELSFDFRPMVGGVPFILFSLMGWFPVFWVVLGSLISVSQFIHYYAHHKAPPPIAFLQRCGIILSTAGHDKHHTGDHNQDYCMVSGWNNWWFNKLVRKG